MPQIKGKVKGLRGIEDCLPQALQVLIDEATVSADATARAQRDLILSSQTPVGPQKLNELGTIARKKARKVSPNVALYDTGLLANPAMWRTRRLSHGRGVKLTPPKGRVDALLVLRKRGYVTVFDALPAGMVERLRDRIQRRLDVISRRRA